MSAEVAAPAKYVKDACAILDRVGNVVSCNERFVEAALAEGMDEGEFRIASLGSGAVDGLAYASQGLFRSTHAYIERDGLVEGWHASFVPQPDGHAMLILTGTSTDHAFYDALTALPNRHVAQERLQREWERWQRSDKHSFGLALADIDRFKRINDHYGHDIGDKALVQVSRSFKSGLRGGDWVARWGGEEFLLFFHDTGREGAMNAAERCRKSVYSNPFESETGLRFKMSVSMGVVATEDYDKGGGDGLGIVQMINDADVLLYDAKHEGRDRCLSRTGRDWVNIEASEINELLRDDKLKAVGREVKGGDGAKAATFWQPAVEGMGSRAARHLFQSAFRANLIGSVEARWLDVCRETASKGGVHCNFVVVNPQIFQTLHEHAAVIQAARRFHMDGNKVVLASKFEPVSSYDGGLVRDALADANLEACLWLSKDGPTVPTGLLGTLRPSYVMLASQPDDGDGVFSDLLLILRSYGTKLVLPESMRGGGVDYPDVLYVEEPVEDTA